MNWNPTTKYWTGWAWGFLSAAGFGLTFCALSHRPVVDIPNRVCIMGTKVNNTDNDTTPTQSPSVTKPQDSGEGRAMRDEEE